MTTIIVVALLSLIMGVLLDEFVRFVHSLDKEPPENFLSEKSNLIIEQLQVKLTTIKDKLRIAQQQYIQCQEEKIVYLERIDALERGKDSNGINSHSRG